MKETIIIEQFDNGITITATNDEGTERRVSLDHSKEQEIGKMIWETVRFMMDRNAVNSIALEIDYKNVEIKEIEIKSLTNKNK